MINRSIFFRVILIVHCTSVYSARLPASASDLLLQKYDEYAHDLSTLPIKKYVSALPMSQYKKIVNEYIDLIDALVIDSALQRIFSAIHLYHLVQKKGSYRVYVRAVKAFERLEKLASLPVALQKQINAFHRSALQVASRVSGWQKVAIAGACVLGAALVGYGLYSVSASNETLMSQAAPDSLVLPAAAFYIDSHKGCVDIHKLLPEIVPERKNRFRADQKGYVWQSFNQQAMARVWDAMPAIIVDLLRQNKKEAQRLIGCSISLELPVVRIIKDRLIGAAYLCCYLEQVDRRRLKEILLNKVVFNELLSAVRAHPQLSQIIFEAISQDLGLHRSTAFSTVQGVFSVLIRTPSWLNPYSLAEKLLTNPRVLPDGAAHKIANKDSSIWCSDAPWYIIPPPRR